MRHVKYAVKITRADGDTETFEVKASSVNEAEYHAKSKARDSGFLGPFDVSPVMEATPVARRVKHEG